MTTVSTSQPEATVNLFELMEAWISRDDAVYPYDVVYAPDDTRESNEKEGEEEMVSSQHLAAAAALVRARLQGDRGRRWPRSSRTPRPRAGSRRTT